MMNIIRANGIPIWITIVALLIGTMGAFLGITGLVDPTSAVGYIDGADVMALSWAGRNLGVAVALLIAVALRNASGYAVAFGGAMFREVGDIFASLVGDTGFGIPVLAIFLIVEIICLALSLRTALAAPSK